MILYPQNSLYVAFIIFAGFNVFTTLAGAPAKTQFPSGNDFVTTALAATIVLSPNSTLGRMTQPTLNKQLSPILIGSTLSLCDAIE